MELSIKILDEKALIPEYATLGAAGFDLAVPEDVVVYPGSNTLIKIGWAVAVPQGFEMQVRPRSGLSLKTGLVLANSPGTIDSDYRGEVGIIAYNRFEREIRFLRGDRIAQAIVAPVILVKTPRFSIHTKFPAYIC